MIEIKFTDYTVVAKEDGSIQDVLFKDDSKPMLMFGSGRFIQHMLAEIVRLRAVQSAPIDMILYCPNCGQQHIDEPGETTRWANNEHPPRVTGEPWTNPPHRSHLCHACGSIWRPADVATNGVAAIKTAGKADDHPVPKAGAAWTQPRQNAEQSEVRPTAWPAALAALSARSMLGITIRYRRQPCGTPWPAPWQIQHHSTKWIDACQTAYGDTLPEALGNLLAILHEKADWMGGWPMLASDDKEAK